MLVLYGNIMGSLSRARWGNAREVKAAARKPAQASVGGGGGSRMRGPSGGSIIWIFKQVIFAVYKVHYGLSKVYSMHQAHSSREGS